MDPARPVVGLLLLMMSLGWAAEPPARLVVGGDAMYPPFEWLEDSGQPRGFNVELIRMLAANDGVEVEFRLGAWPDALAALDRGDVDTVPMFVSEPRQQRYRFTNVYVYQTHALFGRAGWPAVDPSGGFEGLRLAVESGSLAETELARLGAPPAAATTPNTEQALRLVERGEVDYALLAAPVAVELIGVNDWGIERKSPPLWPRGYAFAVRDDREALADWLQASLVDAVADGRYLELYNRWADRVEPGRDRAADWLRFTLWALAALALAGAAFVIWNFSLRRQVAERTREVVEELESRRQAERRSRDLARREPITGLYNVRYFCGKCAELLEEASQPAAAELMLIRLVELESVIRTFGYHVAERMVLGFGEAVNRTFSDPVAHLGRGTFAVFDRNGAASKQLDRLQQAVYDNESLVHPRFVAGSAFCPEDDVEVGELLQKAELALAESQARQCRWTRYHSALQYDPVDLRIVESFRVESVAGLWFALQPQIRLADRRLCSAELLARWNHPDLGEIEPVRFIPLLENAGLIGRLTEQACAAATDTLNGMGGADDLTLSVNASVRDLLDPQFARRVARRLEDRGVPGRRLKLEITETGLISDRETVRVNLLTLTELGVTISIDDFGTGYSSLDYLSRFPIREVKIDRSFVVRMLESSRDLSIVRSTIAMAHELDMVVVGEGCETDAHIDRLAELGCDLAQGWAVGYPVPAAQFRQRAGSGAGLDLA